MTPDGVIVKVLLVTAVVVASGLWRLFA